jgi:hypothetical protein
MLLLKTYRPSRCRCDGFQLGYSFHNTACPSVRRSALELPEERVIHKHPAYVCQSAIVGRNAVIGQKLHLE